MDILVIDRSQGSKTFDVVHVIYRTPKQHDGWQTVRYKGKEYYLQGGMTAWHFIDLNETL